MKRKLLGNNLCLAAMLALLVPVIVYSFSSGPPPQHTGGFNEADCTECHRGTAVNAGGGSVAIKVSAPFYSSSGVYNITVTVSDPQQQRWGFELSARTQDGRQAGTLTAGSDGNTQVTTFQGIQYISHTFNGTRAGTRNSADFNFTWQAPETSSGPVVFHAAGNAANGNFTNSGDRIYTTSLTLPPEAAPPPVTGAPAVNNLGVVSAASFAPGSNPLAPGSIATIFGSNLNDGSAVLFSSFGPDGKLVSTLGGAQVLISGQPAPLFFSTPTQLAVQIPAELTGSSASLQVATRGQTSPPATILLDTAVPGIFTVSQDGKGQGAILIGDTDTIAARAGSIPGRNTRPVRGGEFISIYCTGLGRVEPALPTGVPAGANASTVAPTVTIDGVPATVQYSGTAPGFVGLNQINVQVPNGIRAADDIPVVVTISGKQSNTATIAVSGQ